MSLQVFFVKYNDPIYVKLEKLDIIIRLACDSNIQQVLAELKEYATEVDVDFVRKAVRAIGRCAIKVEGSAQRCVDTLLDLIQTKVNYVVQEAIVVIKDIFRKYPNKYGNFDVVDIVFEPFRACSAICTRRMIYSMRSDHICRVLMGACDPMPSLGTRASSPRSAKTSTRSTSPRPRPR